MSPDDPVPNPLQIAENPELAILAALELTLDLVVRTLVAHYPELADPEHPYWCKSSVASPRHASQIIDAATSLRKTLALYQRAITPADNLPAPDAPDPEDDVPS
jgi:hypothetical protein